MPFQLSPGVNVTEIDLTTVIPAVATTDAAIGGVFRWGPVGKPSLVVSEEELAAEYGKPDNNNAETFFTAASFLAYSNRLYVSRAHHSTGDDVRQSVYATNGSEYLIVNSDIDSDIVDGMLVTEIIDGIDLNTTIATNGVDSTTITETVVDLGASVSSGNTLDPADSLFTIGNPFDLIAGEPVLIDSSNTLPTGLSNTTTYYIVDVVVGGSETTFGLSTTQGGGKITLTNTGDGDMTVTRSGASRITMSKNYTGSTGGYNFEFAESKYSFNAIANNQVLDSDALLSQHIVKNEDEFDDSNFDDSVLFVARYPGALGNSLKVSVCDSAAAYESSITFDADQSLSIAVGANTGTITGADASDVNSLMSGFSVGDLVKVGNSIIGVQYLEITSIPTATTDSITIGFDAPLVTTEDISITNQNVTRSWKYRDLVEAKPGRSNYVARNGNTAANDELHVIVADEDGEISGIPGTILEVWQGLSRATDAKSEDGGALYYKEVINQSSRYIWWANDNSNAPSATALNVASSSLITSTDMSFNFGRDIAPEGSSSITGDMLRAYDVFKSAEDIDISLVLCGKSFGINDVTVPNYIVDNICERRKDCVAFISPAKADVVANSSDITEDVVAFRNNLRSSSYAVLDSGYKYMYDKYNDIYRWVPINGDTAGLCAYTDDSRDPWWSPAGFNRGNLKNVVKLAWNPKKAERDILYKNGVNPIVNFPGQGIVMFGDKTLLSKPSAFDRINVRRLFIVLEKAIATAAKFTLFEFNDEFTRASFVNLVTPFLRDVQGRRGIFDFAVICDETNNTGEVIDRNEFVGDIYIKPARSINFIQLNFVAVRTGVEFSEVIGQF